MRNKREREERRRSYIFIILNYMKLYFMSLLKLNRELMGSEPCKGNKSNKSG
jgi:hypothetical protein